MCECFPYSETLGNIVSLIITEILIKTVLIAWELGPMREEINQPKTMTVNISNVVRLFISKRV